MAKKAKKCKYCDFPMHRIQEHPDKNLVGALVCLHCEVFYKKQGYGGTGTEPWFRLCGSSSPLESGSVITQQEVDSGKRNYRNRSHAWWDDDWWREEETTGWGRLGMSQTPSNQTPTGYTYRKAGGWKVKNKTEKVECSLCKPPNIYIEDKPKVKIELLMDEYRAKEWVGYLVGQEIKDSGDMFVEDISIPPHSESSSASAEAEPFHVPEGCIGIIHSHHSMGAFHSATDKEYVDKNYIVSITVARKNNTLEYDAVSRQVTPCGREAVGKCEVHYVAPEPGFDTKEFLKQARENIDKPQKPKVSTAIQKYGVLAPYYSDGRGMVLSAREYEEQMKEAYDNQFGAFP